MYAFAVPISQESARPAETELLGCGLGAFEKAIRSPKSVTNSTGYGDGAKEPRDPCRFRVVLAQQAP